MIGNPRLRLEFVSMTTPVATNPNNVNMHRSSGLIVITFGQQLVPILSLFSAIFPFGMRDDGDIHTVAA